MSCKLVGPEFSVVVEAALVARPSAARHTSLGWRVPIHERVPVFVNHSEHLAKDPFLDVHSNAGPRFVEPREDPIDFPLAAKVEGEDVQTSVLNEAPDVANRCGDADPQPSPLLISDFGAVARGKGEVAQGVFVGVLR